MSAKFRAYLARAGLVTTLAAIAVAVVASPASAVSPQVLPPPDGPPVSCQAKGTTNFGVTQVMTGACLSNQTAFYAYLPNYPKGCYQAGYIARVYTTSYAVRFEGNWCEDGVWHFSSKWGSDEPRFSWMQIYSAGTSWWMLQYK